MRMSYEFDGASCAANIEATFVQACEGVGPSTECSCVRGEWFRQDTDLQILSKRQSCMLCAHRIAFGKEEMQRQEKLCRN